MSADEVADAAGTMAAVALKALGEVDVLRRLVASMALAVPVEDLPPDERAALAEALRVEA